MCVCVRLRLVTYTKEKVIVSCFVIDDVLNSKIVGTCACVVVADAFFLLLQKYKDTTTSYSAS